MIFPFVFCTSSNNTNYATRMKEVKKTSLTPAFRGLYAPSIEPIYKDVYAISEKSIEEFNTRLKEPERAKILPLFRGH